jgi:hypothetical protein
MQLRESRAGSDRHLPGVGEMRRRDSRAGSDIFSTKIQKEYMPLIYQKQKVSVVDNFATGEAMRKLRVSNRISLNQIGKEMMFSAPYISDLEKGHRGWNEVLADNYEKAVEVLKTK